MSKWKKIVAGLMATAMVGSLAACGSNTAYAMTIDGMQVKAGVYIYFAYSAYSEAVSTLQSQNSELDTSDNDVVKAQKIDGKDTETWIKDKTLEYCQQYVAVEQKYSELSLELSDESKTEIDNTLNNFWDTNSKTFEANGISKESVKLVLENTYHTNDLFLYYYDIDGEEGVTEDELKEYYIDNDARVRYIKIDLKDGNGDLLKSDAKDAMLEQVNGYLKRVEAKEGDEEAKYADYILHVVDASNPQHEKQMHIVYDTLHQLDIREKTVITLFNKQDAVTEREPLRDLRADHTLAVSAREGTGLDELKELLAELLRENKVLIERTIAYADAGILQQIRKQGELLEEDYRPEGIYVKAYVPLELYGKL